MKKINISWVVVGNPGCDDEYETAEFTDYGQAVWTARLLSVEGDEFDVMQRGADGNLTTEF